MASNIIMLSKGDTYIFDFVLQDPLYGEEGVYELQDNEVLYFALMYPHTKIEDAVILRGYTKQSLDGVAFEILSADGIGRYQGRDSLKDRPEAFSGDL